MGRLVKSVQQRLIDEDLVRGLDLADTTYLYEIGRDDATRISCIDGSLFTKHRGFRVLYSSKYDDPERRLLDAPPTLRHDHLRRRLSPLVQAVDAGAVDDISARLPVNEAFLRASLVNNVARDAQLVGDSTPLTAASRRRSAAPTPRPPRASGGCSAPRCLAAAGSSASPPPPPSAPSPDVPAKLRQAIDADPILAESGIESIVYTPMSMEMRIQSRSTYCRRAKRSHGTNRSFFHVYLRTATFRCGCYSSACSALPRPQLTLGDRSRQLLAEFLATDPAMAVLGDDAAAELFC